MHIVILYVLVVGVNFQATVYERLEVSSISDLGNALLLLSEQSLWSDDNLISVIDEIVGMIYYTIIVK